MPELKGLSQVQFAKSDGCTPKLIRNKIKEGILRPFDDGSLDPADIGGPWRKRPKKTEVSVPAPIIEVIAQEAAEIINADEFVIPELYRSAAKKEAYLAELRKLEYDREKALVAPIDDIVREVATAFSRVRKHLSMLPVRVAESLCLMNEFEPIRAFLKNEIETILKELNLEIAHRKPDEPEPV